MILLFLWTRWLIQTTSDGKQWKNVSALFTVFFSKASRSVLRAVFQLTQGCSVGAYKAFSSGPNTIRNTGLHLQLQWSWMYYQKTFVFISEHASSALGVFYFFIFGPMRFQRGCVAMHIFCPMPLEQRMQAFDHTHAIEIRGSSFASPIVDSPPFSSPCDEWVSPSSHWFSSMGGWSLIYNGGRYHTMIEN